MKTRRNEIRDTVLAGDLASVAAEVGVGSDCQAKSFHCSNELVSVAR